MTAWIQINACDKFDKEEQKKDYYITFSRNKRKIVFTNQIFTEIYKHFPNKIIIDTDNFKAVFLALYTNTLVAEGYTLVCKPSIERDIHGKIAERSVWGHTLEFVISKEKKAKLKRVMEKAQRARARRKREEEARGETDYLTEDFLNDKDYVRAYSKYEKEKLR